MEPWERMRLGRITSGSIFRSQFSSTRTINTSQKKMAVFECCTKQFVKDTGRLTLRPVVDLNSAIRFNILCVVIKKRSRWIWKSVKYEATPFTLNEILTKVSLLSADPQVLT